MGTVMIQCALWVAVSMSLAGYDDERARLMEALDIPGDIELVAVSNKRIAQHNLWELPHIQLFSGHTPNSLPPEHTRDNYVLNIYEIDYEVRYPLKGETCKHAGKTYLLLPAGLLNGDAPLPMLTHCTGSTKGIAGYTSDDLKTPIADFKGNMRAMCVIFHAYYLQIPVHIIPKRGPGLKETFSHTKQQDPFGRRYTACFAARLAATRTLDDLGVSLSKEKVFVSGLSRGAFRAMLLSAFDPSVTHTFAVPGWESFRLFVAPDGEVHDTIQGRADLLAQGIDASDIQALIRARTVVAFSMTDECVHPGHHRTLMDTNRKRKALSLEPITLKLFHEEPASFWGNELEFGHVLPRVESIEFFANAMFE